jgi:hypothetical protein
MTTYDDWKTTDPADYGPHMGECDCCGGQRPLTRCWAYGIETYACEECRGGDPDEAYDRQRDERADG